MLNLLTARKTERKYSGTEKDIITETCSCSIRVFAISLISVAEALLDTGMVIGTHFDLFGQTQDLTCAMYSV